MFKGGLKRGLKRGLKGIQRRFKGRFKEGFQEGFKRGLNLSSPGYKLKVFRFLFRVGIELIPNVLL